VNFIKNIRDLSLVVQWNAVDDVIHYTLTWSGGGFTATRMTSYTITGLTVDTTYTITVSAANRCGDGLEFTTSILFSLGKYVHMCICTLLLLLLQTY